MYLSSQQQYLLVTSRGPDPESLTVYSGQYREARNRGLRAGGPAERFKFNAKALTAGNYP